MTDFFPWQLEACKFWINLYGYENGKPISVTHSSSQIVSHFWKNSND